MEITTTEVLIIGSGVIGSSIAYHLARQGRQVIVVERSKVASRPAASWASAGGVRRQGRHPAEAQLAIEAIARWPTLEQDLEADLHYRRGGNLLLAESDTEAEQLVTFVQRQHELGFTDVELIDLQQVHDLVPGLHERVVAGSYSPADGQADPPRTTRAFATAAQRHGAIYWNETPCTGLLMQGQKIAGALTGRGEVQAERIVLAAGTWSDEIATTIGILLPIRTRALQMILSTPADSITVQPVLSAVGRSLSLKQLSNGAFFLGGGWLGDPASNRSDYQLRPASIEGNWKTACELLPQVGQQQIANAWCGLEAQSIDNIPFIGPIPGIDNLTLALGFSGHGFALAPAIGRSVADQLAGLPTPELDGLSPGRIASFQPELVEAFITETTTTDQLE
ncbi:MAG TPA: FAD-binding oxidoreductase [Ktedonobacteraceae bacterium]